MWSTMQTAISLLLFYFVQVISEREHKVHNIVLYPEKHSWCQITPIQQIIASPGYESVTIDNNVCVGACYSYSIPKTQPAEPGELIGPYCDSCQPSEIKCYHVNLKQIEKNVEGPKILQKRVQIITNCSCQSCDKVRSEDCKITDGNTLELPQNLFTIDKNANKSVSEEIPDLLERNNSYHILPTLDNDLKKLKYKKWFESHQNEIERTYSSDAYRLFLKQNRDNNIKVEEDLDDPDLPINFGLEGMPSGLRDSQIGIQQKAGPILEDDDDDISSEETETHSNDIVVLPNVEKHHEIKQEDLSGLKTHPTGHHKGHHHIGEEQLIGMNVVHMIKGPHGSLVAAPVEAKLQIDSDALQPNSEGVVIDYGAPDSKTHSKVAELFEN
ncbi:uncharacterized protein [Diabrotica undecimpunctata]|uniref:uncharacterized protein isoform X1 n=1 Tax=Diabrotica undecimpunctata TaxID=50387 RepID=UPI003B637F5E